MTMKNLQGFNTFTEDELIRIENMEGESYTMYDSGLADMLPEAFYEYVEDQLSGFYKGGN